MSTLADRLRLAMNGPPAISVADLARACGIRPPSVSNWLSGKTKNMEGMNLYKAALKLNVSQVWLAQGKGAMRPGGQNTAAEAVDLAEWLSHDELALITIYAKLPPKKQKLFMQFVKTFVEEEEAVIEEEKKAGNHEGW